MQREPRLWRLEGAALRLWQEATAEWKRQARGDETGSTSAALDKSDIQCARIALVIAESLHPGRGGPIPAEAMRCAVAIMQFALDCHRALPEHQPFALSYKEARLAQKVDTLAAWLETRKDYLDGRPCATRRQIQRAHVAGVREASGRAVREYLAVHVGSVVERELPNGTSQQIILAPARAAMLSGVATVAIVP